jgi:glycosyltransferase involved in cell wall biosynthesis
VGTRRVSIGLPVYNGDRFLEQTLDLLLGQSLREFELAIMDNGSTDRTQEICRAYAGRDERIRYYRSVQNRGATWNFNRAFTLTDSEYFKWSAHDDLCEPSFLERCVSALDAKPGAVLAYPKTRLIDEAGDVLRDHEDGLALSQQTAHERLGRLVAALGYANPVYGLIRSSALRRTRLLGDYPSADYVLLAELALLGEFAELPERLFLRRIHPQMSRAQNPDPASAARWFRPHTHVRFRAESSRLYLEHLAAIFRAPLSAAERLRCFATFARVGSRRYGHHVAREAGELIAHALTAGVRGIRRRRATQ